MGDRRIIRPLSARIEEHSCAADSGLGLCARYSPISPRIVAGARKCELISRDLFVKEIKI